MVAEPRRMSLAEFLALPDDGNLHEFVRGEVRSMPPPKGRHGLVEAEVIGAIYRYLDDRARQLGWTPEQGLERRRRLVGVVAGGEFGLQFSLPDDPHQVRGADAAYVPAEQYARVTWEERSYFPEVPPLVIEVISPSESATDVNEKVQDYLAGGARRVWYFYPERQTVHIHDAEAPTRVVHRDEVLTDEELLPGFALPLSYLFSPAPAAEN
jgi:Uma2 family endonuclease